MKIYTRTGDKGKTSLFGGKRVPKNSLRIEAYGTIDELNSFTGIARGDVKDEKVRETLEFLQNKLFNASSDLASPLDLDSKKFSLQRITADDVKTIETAIDSYEAELEELTSFILPGGSKGAAALHVCRTVARRAERAVLSLSDSEEINPEVTVFLNRLSDLFFVLARFENKQTNVKDLKWQK